MRTAKTNTIHSGPGAKAAVLCLVLCFISLMSVAQDKIPKKHATHSPQRVPAGIRLVMRHDLGTCSYGYADSSGRWVIPPQYQVANPFSTLGLAIVKKDEKYGIIDTANHVVVPFEYDIIEQGSNRWHNQRLQMHSGPGNLLDPYYKCRKNSLWGVIDQYGRLAMPPKYYDLVGYYSDGSIVHGQEYGLKFINQFGREVVLSGCRNISRYNNLLVFRSYTDRSDRDYPYQEKTFTGLADTAGHILLPPEYDNIEFYNDTLVMADSGWTTTLFNARGKMLFCFSGYKLYPHTALDNSLFYIIHKTTAHNMFGLADSHFKITIPVMYENLNPVYDSSAKKVVFIAEKNHKNGIVNAQNKTIVPFKYDLYYSPPKYVKDTGAFVVWTCNYRQYRINVSTGKATYIPQPKIIKEYYESGTYIVSVGGRSGIVSIKNDTILPVKCTWLGDLPQAEPNPRTSLHKRLVYAEINNRMVCFDMQKPRKEHDINESLPGKYHVLWGRGRFYSRSHGRWEWQRQSRIVDYEGKTVYKTDDHLEKIIFDKYVTKKIHENFGLFDFKGRRIWKGTYRFLEEDTLSHQMFIMNDHAKCGIADKNLKIIIDTIYPGISHFMSPGYYILLKDSTAPKSKESSIYESVVDINGHIILPFADQECTQSTPWAFVVTRHRPEKTGIVSFDGKTQLLPFDCDAVMFEENNNLWLRKQNIWYLYLGRQNRLLPEAYTRVQNFHHGMAKVWRHDSIALIDTIGNIISDFSPIKLASRNISLARWYIDPGDRVEVTTPGASDNINTAAEKIYLGLKTSLMRVQYGSGTELIDSLKDDNVKRVINNFLLDTLAALMPGADGYRGLTFITPGSRYVRNGAANYASGHNSQRLSTYLPYIIKIHHVSQQSVSLLYTWHSNSYNDPDHQILKNYSVGKEGLEPLDITDLFISHVALRQVSLLVWDSLKKSDLGDFDCKNPELLISAKFDKFALRPDGITFYITNDEARYSSHLRSAIYITIPYKTLLPWLKPGSPAWKMFN